MEHETNETIDKLEKPRENLARDEHGRLLPGQPSLNPAGKPKGTYSLKTKIIKLLEERPELEKQLIADLLEKEQGLLLQMVDGKPKQSMDLAVKELPIIEVSEAIIKKHDTTRSTETNSSIN